MDGFKSKEKLDLGQEYKAVGREDGKGLMGIII